MNVDSDGDDVTSGGKLFHVRAAATWNAVERRVVWDEQCRRSVGWVKVKVN